MFRKITLRERKKIKTKISIFNASLSLIGSKTFKEVRLEDICDAAQVSKVTFFKFFSRNEDVLSFYMYLWLIDRIIELKRQRLRGMEALRYILTDISNNAKEKPGLMLSLISFLAEERMHPRMPPISETEMYILYPELDDTEIRYIGLHHLIRNIFLEAIEDGTVCSIRSPEEFAKTMISVFYGVFLTANLYRDNNIMKMYELHLLLFSDR